LRRLFRKSRFGIPAAFSGIQSIGGTIAVVHWLPGRQKHTDRLVSRLIAISAIKEVEEI
jgi:hypothetical protein